ncbi:MAG: NAD-dependent epimerase/dehydratase family protein [Candidatus Margulisiibacteriota bacterium]
MKRTVVVTGAAGFLGKAVSRRLKKHGFHVRSIDRVATGENEEFVVDLADNDFFAKISRLPKADVIVHLAAVVNFENIMDDLFVPNVVATAELARWAKATGAYFVFASSITVHGLRTALINQATGIAPDTAYARSKWLGEELVRAAGLEHLILRISGIYGHNGPGHLALNRAIDQAMLGNLPTLVGDGKAKRNYVYVDDLAATIVNAIDRKIIGTHFAAGPVPVTIADMLKEICAVFLPGQSPIGLPGETGSDQIVEPSSELLAGRSFKQVLEIIKSGGMA